MNAFSAAPDSPGMTPPPHPTRSAPAALPIFLFLSLPCVLFYTFIGQPGLALAFAAMTLAAALLCFHRNVPIPLNHRPGNLASTIACAAAALILTCIGGEGRLFPATADWTIRDAVLHDLILRHWPFLYKFEGQSLLLRAPLGMYLLPAAAGKISGLFPGYLALWLQNSLALCLVFRIFIDGPELKRRLAVLVVFCIFSGWDVVGALILNVCRMTFMHAAFVMPADIGGWMETFQYSSTMTLIFWVPNHALAGWFFTALLLLWDRRQIGIGLLAAGAVLAGFWSPFASMGAAPFLVKAGLQALSRRQVDWRNAAAAIALTGLAVPIFAYLASDSTAAPKGFQTLTLPFLLRYELFMAVEILPFVLLNQFFGKPTDQVSPSTYLIAVASLFLIPFYHLGVANDFVMRASIPALAILAIRTGHTAYDVFSNDRKWRKALMAVVLALGSLTGLDQIYHIVASQNHGISSCDLVQQRQQERPDLVLMWMYFANETRVPMWLKPAAPEIYATGLSAEPCNQKHIR